MGKNAFTLIKRTVSFAVTVVLILIFVLVMQQKLTGEVPGLFGYHLMYVLTGSMEPELNAGDAVLVKNFDAADLRVGDVICYWGTGGDMNGKLITHKVITAPHEEDGKTVLQTKGVANMSADEPIEADQVMGKVVLRLRILGKLYRFFCTLPGLIAVITPVIIAMVIEIKRMVVCVREDVAEAVENEQKNVRNTNDGK